VASVAVAKEVGRVFSWNWKWSWNWNWILFHLINLSPWAELKEF